MTDGSYCRSFQKEEMKTSAPTNEQTPIVKNGLEELFVKVRDANKQLTLEKIKLERELSSLKAKIKQQETALIQEREQKSQLCQDIENLKRENLRLLEKHEARKADDLNLSHIIITRGIKSLLHVTNFDNLNTILKDGLVPRESVRKDAKTLDITRADLMLDCNSLSVGRINFSYLEAKRKELRTGTRFVCIHIDPTILLDDNVKHYCCHNAATSSIRRQTVTGQLTKWYDFENIFNEEVSYMRSNDDAPRFIRRPADLQADYPTSDQAEILYQGTIPAVNFLYIGFPSKRELDEAKNLLHQYKIKGVIEPFLLNIST